MNNDGASLVTAVEDKSPSSAAESAIGRNWAMEGEVSSGRGHHQSIEFVRREGRRKIDAKGQPRECGDMTPVNSAASSVPVTAPSFHV